MKNITIKKVIGWMHLWLGLVSGTIVFIVCLTGCTYVFSEEITDWSESWKKIEKEDRAFILPSQAKAIAKREVPGKEVSSLSMHYGEAMRLSFYKKDEYNMALLLNPYSGEVIRSCDYKKEEFRFFDFILKGHRFLWLPWKIGRPIVNYATLTFVIILISGLVLWWPKNKPAAKQRVWFKWKDTTKWKRKNYDLHNILGFYAMLFLLCIALTGMTWGLEWFSKSVYYTVSGGSSLADWQESKSDTTMLHLATSSLPVIDQVWIKLTKEAKNVHEVYLDLPESGKASSAIGAFIAPESWGGSLYDLYSFDQYTGKEITLPNQGKYADAVPAEKLQRMYYGIHVGSILGLPGKVLAFLASFIGATLPVTGIYIWWGRRKKEKKAVVAPAKITTEQSIRKKITIPVKIPRPVPNTVTSHQEILNQKE